MNILQRLLLEPLERSYESFLKLLPGFFSSIVLILCGIFLGFVFKHLFLRLLRVARVDKLAQRLGTTEALTGAGIHSTPSHLLSKLGQWIVILVFLIISMQNLRMPTIEHLMEQFLLYLPNVFVAAFILIVGYLLGNFFARATLIALVNAGISDSRLAARFIRFVVFTLTATMALEQLGIGRDTVIVAFAITFGGVVLAFAIAFGLAGRGTAKRYLEKRTKKEENKDEIHHL